MARLSTPAPPADEPARDRPRRRPLDLLALTVVPVAVGVVFVAVLISERAGVDADLQIVSPSAVVPGRTVAVRAFHFHRLEAPSGPDSLDLPGRLELRDEGGRTVAEAPLEASAAAGLEGVLSIPPDAAGRLELRATAPVPPGDESHVVAPLRVVERPEPPPPRGRLAMPLQRYRGFPVRAEDGAVPPSSLELRVVGGTCIPEQRCTLLVHVGEPAASVAIEESAAVTPTGEPPAEETAGIVALPVVVHGPEAQARVVARRGGEVVARRAWRLPVVLGSFAFSVPAPVLEAPARPPLSFAGVEEGRGIIVDAYRDGLWERTGSVPAEDVAGGDATLPGDPLGPGLWRLQARTDPFGTDSAAARVVYVRDPDRSDADVLQAVAERSRREPWEDPFAARVPLEGVPAERQIAFMLTYRELDVLPLPQAISGRMQAESGLGERRVRLRWLAVAAFLLGGLFVMAFVLRRGLSANVQAREVMRQAGDEHVDTPAHHRRMTWNVLAVVAAVGVAFLAAASLLLARGGL